MEKDLEVVYQLLSEIYNHGIQVPEKYIHSGRVSWHDGKKTKIKREKVLEILSSKESLYSQGIDNIHFIINIEQIYDDINPITENLLKKVGI